MFQVYIPSGDILLQFSKIMSGLTSATLHNQRSNLLASLNEEEKKAYEEGSQLISSACLSHCLSYAI